MCIRFKLILLLCLGVLRLRADSVYPGPIEKICVIARDDMRVGHALMLGIDSQMQVAISELSPGYPLRVFGNENIRKRLLYYFKTQGFAYTWWKSMSAFCYTLDAQQQKRAKYFFRPVAGRSPLENGEFSNISYNCTHYVEESFEFITKEQLRVRNIESPIKGVPTPRVLKGTIDRNQFNFKKNSQPIERYIGKSQVYELLVSLSIEPDLSLDGGEDWFEPELNSD